MSTSRNSPTGKAEAPPVLLTTPTLKPTSSASNSATQEDGNRLLHRRRPSRSESRDARHIKLPAQSATDPRSSASSIYMGSFGHTRRRSKGSLKTSGNSTPGTPRASISHSHLESLLQGLEIDLETYGMQELRDGFFDSSFFKPPEVDHEDLMRDAEYALPLAFRKKHPLSPRNFLPKQWHEIKEVLKAVLTTRAGIKLTKSFMAFFIAYILCLVDTVRVWLGRYSYFIVLSTIINHPGRTVGAQIDGTVLTIAGTATGLGWGAFALWVSDSTSVARSGYGGILATFLIIFMAFIAAMRSYFIRMYQFVLCAGIAITYTCLSDTSEAVDWKKLFSYGVPWVLGQALCFLICCTVFPDAGSRPLAVSLHGAFDVMQRGLIIPQTDVLYLHRELAWTFVNLSQAHRDLVLDVSITRFRPSDVIILRNLMQAVIRSLLALRMQTQLFDSSGNTKLADDNAPVSPPTKLTSDAENDVSKLSNLDGQSSLRNEVTVDIDIPPQRPSFFRANSEERAVKLVVGRLADPSSELLLCMRTSLKRCDAVLMDMSGYRKYIGPDKNVSTDILGSLTGIRKSMIKYDEAEETLMDNPELPPSYSNHPEVVELFLFVHPVRQAATTVEALLVKVNEMQQRHPRWKLYLPSYPFSKALQRTNAQVRHDRGGVTAGFYFHSQSQLAKTMKGMANVYKPHPHMPNNKEDDEDDPVRKVLRTDTIGKYEEEEDVAMDRNSQLPRSKRFRYKAWVVLHRLQGFETRFALKVAIVTSLLSVPAWLEQSRGWWNTNESWWAVVMVSQAGISPPCINSYSSDIIC